MIVDTHVHVVAADRARYPLQPPGVGSSWYLECPVSAEEFTADASAAGVDRAVLVQPYGAYGTDNRYAVDAARAAPDRFVSVVVVDGVTPELRRLGAEPTFGGVRLFAIGDPPLVTLDGAAARAIARLARADRFPLVATTLADGLPALDELLGAFPDLDVVLDHCGFADFTGGPPYLGAAPLFALARHERLVLKITSHVLEQAEGSGGDARDLVGACADHFGGERLVWGSDWSQTHDRPYAALVELGRHACSRLSPGDRDQVLAGNALRLWPALAGQSV